MLGRVESVGQDWDNQLVFRDDPQTLIKHYDTGEGTRKWIMKPQDIDQNYDYYRMFSERIGVRPVLSRRAFFRIKGATPNVGMKRRRVDEWTAREKADFESIVGAFCDTYGALTTTWQ